MPNIALQNTSPRPVLFESQFSVDAMRTMRDKPPAWLEYLVARGLVCNASNGG